MSYIHHSRHTHYVKNYSWDSGKNVAVPLLFKYVNPKDWLSGRKSVFCFKTATVFTFNVSHKLKNYRMEEIKKFIDSIYPMSESDWNCFSSKLHKKKINTNSTIIKIGAIENYLSFISEGIVRLYIPKEESVLTFGFLFENEFVTSYDSFITQTPSHYQIETLTSTTLWRISFKDLQEVYKETECGNLIGRRMAENMFLIKSKREISLLNKTAEERYLDLFTERPKLLKQIPLKYIASYIGVTPQALSRIRKRIN